MLPDFIIIPYPVLIDKKLTPTAKQLYGIIYWLQHLRLEKCTASNSVLAEMLESSSGAIANALIQLEESGHITRFFLDENKKIRTHIIANVSFSQKKEVGGSSENRGQGPRKSEDGVLGFSEQSNNIYKYNIPVLEKTDTPSQKKEPIGFEGWMEDQGYQWLQRASPAADDTYPDSWHDKWGKLLSPSKLGALEREWKRSVAPKKEVSPEEVGLTHQVLKVIGWIQEDFRANFDAEMTVTAKDKVMVRGLIKREGYEFVKEYGQWFFSSDEVPSKFKASIKAFCSSTFINQFKANQ